MKRKNNPRFHLGVNSLGRKSWRKNHSVGNTDLSGLREGLDAGPPVSQLPRQLSVPEMAEIFAGAEVARKMTPRRSFYGLIHRSDIEMAKVGIIGGGAIAALITASATALPLLAPLLVGVAAILTAPSAFNSLMARKAKRKHFKSKVVPLREYKREAEEMVKRFPHGRGEVSEVSWEGEIRFGRRVDKGRSFVSKDGVVEILTEQSYAGEKHGSGAILLYPGADLERTDIPFSFDGQGANLRGANLAGARFSDAANMGGGDFRGVEAEKSVWRYVSLRDANFEGANLRLSTFVGGDFAGVNLEGADVTGAWLPEDLTETNITAEQLDSLAHMGPGDLGMPYKIKEVTFDEVVAAHGGDRDSVTVTMWAGDIEVRERITNKVVFGGYDPKDHYIPHWVIQDSKVHVS